MVAFDGSESCHEAEVYYHDSVEDPTGSSIPASVRAHIDSCPHCRRRVQTLREALRELDSRPESALPEKDLQLVAELQAHFELLNEPLACRSVKPFLCNLLSPSVRIRIPTPVTVHVDRCASCSNDLDSLRQLTLGADQLARLGRLYRESPNDDPSACLTESQMDAASSAHFEDMASGVLDHLCVCPRCRRDVYERRRDLLARVKGGAAQTQPLRCEHISMADLFDCVVPYGRQLEFFRTARQRALCEHVRSCPACLERMQQIHHTVFQIAERADSGVVTIYSTDGLGGTTPGAALPTSGRAYPINVRVERHSRRIAGRLMHRLGRPAVRPLARAAFLMAAMIPLAILFVVSVPSASGLSVRQVDQILGRARTVHISVFREGQSEPFRQLWISRNKGVVISQMGSESRIYDLPNRRVAVVRPDLGTVEHSGLNRYDLQAVERSVRRILESSLLNDAPLDAELTRQPETSGPAHARLDVYEMAWNRSSDLRAPLPGKFRVYVDPITRLPQRHELFSWVPATNDWYVQTSLYKYPPDDEIEAYRRTRLGLK